MWSDWLAVLITMRIGASLGPPLPVAEDLSEALSTVLIVVGGLFTIAAAWRFRQHRTTLDPMRPHCTTELVEGGVFAVGRNPKYAGFVIVLVGAALDFDALWALPGPLLFAAWLDRFQIRPEERILRQRFGAAFDACCRRVPRWLGLPRA